MTKVTSLFKCVIYMYLFDIETIYSTKYIFFFSRSWTKTITRFTGCQYHKPSGQLSLVRCQLFQQLFLPIFDHIVCVQIWHYCRDVSVAVFWLLPFSLEYRQWYVCFIKKKTRENHVASYTLHKIRGFWQICSIVSTKL